MKAVEVPAAATFELRGRVLRAGGRHEGFPEDDQPGTFHLAVHDEHEVVGVASFTPREDGAWQLRAMAVDPDRQGRGIGQALLAAGAQRVRDAGGRLLWANGRDTALGFYERAGWRVVGAGFEWNGMPHHRVERALEPPSE